ncbi:MAG: GAF domain-containing protein [Deltaproteobacteria bacterium]|nr:GAF domain-containing protein [Deltaproteobacteria bacterium]
MNSSEVLSRIIDLSNASVDIDQRLMHLTKVLAKAFDVPICAIFLWDPKQPRLTFKCCNEKHPAFSPGLVFALDEGPLGACVLQKTPLIIGDASQLSLWDPHIPQNLTSFNFLSFFPIADDILLYGALALLGEQPRQLSGEEVSLLPIICRQLAGTLCNAQATLQVKKLNAELITLQTIGQAISSTFELGELLNRITMSSAKILQADGAILRLLDEERGVLKAVSSFGLEDEKKGTGPLKPVPLGEEVAGVAALTREPILIPNTQASPFSLKEFSGNISSVICVPLIFRSKTIGTLGLYSLYREGYQEKIFDEEDKNLLSTMASQIAVAIENAIILQRAELLARDKERSVRELSLLYEVSRSMHSTINLDQLLRIILFSITLGYRPGFDRAALFLVDEKENVLKGMVGVGARSREEADQWRKKMDEHSPFSKDWVISEEGIGIAPFEMQVRQARIPLDENRSILIKTLQEKRSFNIEDAASDPEVNPDILRWFGSRAFASVPLIAKDKSIGVISVDNLFTDRPITSADIGLLTLLANQAAMAIENSRLYGNLQELNTQLLQTQNRLIQSEKLAALGEVVASITHEIKNPLVSIGGFARRLERNFQENSPEKKYIRIILKEVKRLENILNETLAYSKEPSIFTGQYQLNRILEDTFSILNGEFNDRNIRVNKDLAPNLPPFFCDPQQLKQVLLNLLMNAMQAIGQDGSLMVKTSFQEQDERKAIQIEVKDSGGGIPLEVLDNIFNPFFTTKQDGTGLGLAIAHKIITLHRGEIEVVNQPGVGATFLIRFPLTD